MTTIDIDTCRVCGGNSPFAFEGKLIGRPVRYFDCPTCRYLQTEMPTWLAEAYASPINESDTGLVARNVLNARRVGALCWLTGKPDARVVDFAGGHGLLVRMLRDAGIPALWSDGFCECLYARGFEHRGEAADFVTAFEAFEHFVDPVHELDRMLKAAPVVFLSTLLAPDPAPQPGAWWYYGEEHGQHVGLYRRQTLQTLAARFGCRLVTNGVDLHAIAPAETKWSFRGFNWIVRFWPIYRRLRMRSLTMSDFDYIRSRAPTGTNE